MSHRVTALVTFQESGEDDEEDDDEEEEEDTDDEEDDGMNGEVMGGHFNEEVRLSICSTHRHPSFCGTFLVLVLGAL